MSKAFRQVTDKPEEAEVITLEWASRMMDDFVGQTATYMEACARSELASEREKYLDSCKEALGHIVIASQMVGALSDAGTLASHIFGEVPVELIDWDPETDSVA